MITDGRQIIGESTLADYPVKRDLSTATLQRSDRKPSGRHYVTHVCNTNPLAQRALLSSSIATSRIPALQPCASELRPAAFAIATPLHRREPGLISSIHGFRAMRLPAS